MEYGRKNSRRGRNGKNDRKLKMISNPDPKMKKHDSCSLCEKCGNLGATIIYIGENKIIYKNEVNLLFL
jgi:hypothetical protein